MTYEEALDTFVKEYNCHNSDPAKCPADGCDPCENYTFPGQVFEAMELAIDALEQVIKRNESYEWCTDCKEYDQEAHCCHRWNKCIRETIKESEEYWYNEGYSAGLKKGCEVKLTKEQNQFIVDALELYADCSMTINDFKKHMEIELKIQELISVLQEGYKVDNNDKTNI